MHVDDPIGRKVEFHHWYSSFLELTEESHFRRLEEHQTATLATRSSSGTSHTMDVVSWIVGRVKLDDPIDGRNLRMARLENEHKKQQQTYIKTSGSNISTDQGALLCIAKLEKRVGSLLLLLFAV